MGEDAAGFAAWQREQLRETLGCLDWPVLARLYRACLADDAEAFGRWSRFLLANRETAELRLEETQRGSALARLLDGWQLGQDSAWRSSLGLSQLGGMAWLGAYWSIPLRQLALGHGFAWLEGAVMAGVKLVPFGQQAAQTLLRDLGEALPAVFDHALTLDDDQIGGGLPMLAIASSRHETQYTRLFRS